MTVWTLSYLDALEEAIATGATSVSYEGKSISYRSLDDMLRIRGILRRTLGISTAPATLQAIHVSGHKPE